MKKIKLGIISFIFSILFLPTVVNAELTCDNFSFNVYQNGSSTIGLNGASYLMRFYDTTSNFAGNIKTYCLNPGKKAGAGSYSCMHRIDPSTPGAYQKFDIAVTRAYQMLTEQGRNTKSAADRILGEIIFRWISSTYDMVGYSGKSFTTNVNTILSYFMPPYTTRWWNVANPEYDLAKNIYNESVLIAQKIDEGYTYERLVSENLIWADQYVYNSETKTEGNLEYVTLTMNVKEATSKPEHIFWSQFKGGCTNTSVKCATMEASGEGDQGKVVIQIDKGNWNGQDYGLYVDSSIYDIRSSGANMMVIRPSNTVRQNMLIVIDGNLAMSGGFSSDGPDGGNRIPIYDNNCKEENGKYYYYSYKNGSVQSKTEVTTEEKMIEYSCPISCVLREDSKRTDESYAWTLAEHRNNVPEGYGSGNFYNKAGYEKFCQTPPPPNNSCKFENGNYYDKKGQLTTKEIYFQQCCDQIDKDSDDYKTYCSCGDPDISFTGACTEFNQSSNLKNWVNDVQNDANLKYCLFNDNNKDKANNSYEMTDQTTVSSNAYCKVSCVEKYVFDLPNAQYSTSGSYFKLSTEISGTRTCYVNGRDTSEGIDSAKFKKDFDAAKKEVIDAYNNYAKWKSAAETSATSKTESATAPGRSCGPGSSSDCESCSGDSASVTVYTKEWSWTAYSVDGSNRTESASYSSGSVSCGTCDCTKTEGDDPDETGGTYHPGDRDSALSTLNTKIENLKKIIREYNDCTGAISNGDEVTNSSGWENNFEFDPIITFDYDQPYTGYNNKFEKVDTITDDSVQKYCTDEVGNQYNCNGSSTIPTKDETYFSCTESGCDWVTSKISTAKYIIKQKTEAAEYQPSNNFSVYIPTGTIALDKDGTYKLYSSLCQGEKNCLPVALNTKTGVFNFNLKFKNIGQFNDNNTNGRLVGESNSVYNVVESSTDASYVCQVVNNCPECEYTCVGDGCFIDGCVGEECTNVCEDCVFDGQSNTFFYRTVSINNMFPSEREYGLNWTNDKGKYTKEKIEAKNSNTNPEDVYKNPEYSYVIDPKQMAEIRRYNKAVGGYANTRMENGDDALECFDLSSSGKNYSNIYCKSVFLNNNNKLYFTEKTRNEEWVLWPDSGFYDNPSRYVVTDGLGPAWK